MNMNMQCKKLTTLLFFGCFKKGDTRVGIVIFVEIRDMDREKFTVMTRVKIVIKHP